MAGTRLYALLILIYASCRSSLENSLGREEDSNLVQLNKLQLQSKSCLKNSINCSPWAYCDPTRNKTCQCIKIPGDPLLCDQFDMEHNSKPHILDCYCATVTNSNIEVGKCDYNCAINRKKGNNDPSYQLLPSNVSAWNDFMCKEFSRSGTLCATFPSLFFTCLYSF